jgi:hypothetical protein
MYNFGRTGYAPGSKLQPLSIESPNKTRGWATYPSRLIALENYRYHYKRGKSNWDLCFLKLPREKEDWCFDDFFTPDGFDRYLKFRGITQKQLDQETQAIKDKYVEPLKTVGKTLALGSVLAVGVAALVAYKVVFD